MTDSFTIAAVDDDSAVRESLDALLRSAGWRARTFASAREFLRSGAEAEAACLLLDVDMPGMTGPELFGELQARGSLLPVVFLTGRPDENLRARMLAAGAAAFLRKPPDGDALLEEAGAAARRRSFQGGPRGGREGSGSPHG